MNSDIPIFPYHPDPLKTGNAKQKDFLCICCHQEKKYAYVGSINSIHDIEEGDICLDCISNGAAADKFNATFAMFIDGNSGIDPLLIKEFEERTPGYSCWHDEVWLTHCNDICEFHGNFIKEELLEHFDEIKTYAEKELGCDKNQLREIISNYDPLENCNPGFYKFVCRKCKIILFHCDFT